MFKKMSAIILCLALILNVLMLSSCIAMVRPGDSSQNGDAASDSSGTSSAAQQSPSYSESPEIATFEAVPGEIIAGMTSTLTWNVMNATSVNISPDIGFVGMSGSITISPVTTTDYTLIASNEYDTVISTIGVSVLTKSISTGLPVIHSFLANPQDINEGDTSSLSWSISNAHSFTISPNLTRLFLLPSLPPTL